MVEQAKQVGSVACYGGGRAHLNMAVGQNQWYHFGVGEFTTHFRTYFSGWSGMFTGLTDLDFDPWPYRHGKAHREMEACGAFVRWAGESPL